MGLSRARTVDRGWVPNLVSGVSVWKLARDLNAPGLFDGRLLEPDVDGPETLPDSVEWDVTGLVPLADARVAQPAEVERAVEAFLECVRRAEAWLADEGSRFREAFTLPALTDGAHYLYSPSDGRLYVKNWGATPHRAGGAEVHVHGPGALLEMRARAAAQVVVEPRPPRRSVAWLGVVGLAILAALVALVGWLATREPAPRQPITAPRVEPPVVEPEPAPPPLRPAEPVLPPPLPIPTQRIHFAVDEPTLRDSERSALEQARAYLEAYPQVRRLRVEGHTDGRGERSHNDELGRDRARAVLAWLIEQGVEPARLEVASCSSRFPLADEATEAGRRENRRVELFVVDPPVERAPHEGCAVDP